LRPDSGGPQSFKDGQLTAQITTIEAGNPAAWLVGCIANIVAFVGAVIVLEILNLVWKRN